MAVRPHHSSLISRWQLENYTAVKSIHVNLGTDNAP